MMDTISRRQLILTIACFTVFFSFGSCNAVWGSVWTSLESTLNLTAHQLKYGLTTRYAAYAIGALASGYLFDVFNRTAMLVGGMTCLAVTLGLTGSFPGSMVAFIALQALFGLGSGIVDTACVVWTVELWSTSR